MRKKRLRLIGILLLVMGIWSINYGIGAISLKITFGKFMVVAGFGTTAAGLFKLFFIKDIKSKHLRTLIKTLHLIMFSLLICFMIIEALVISAAYKKPNVVRTDYIVILGAGLNGSTPSQSLSSRLNEGLKLIKTLPNNVKIVVSGGQGPGETMTEAEAMKEFLINKGIDESRILKEDKSTSTLENIEFTKEIIDNDNNKKNVSITIVTNGYHVFRAKFLAERAGFNKIYSCSAPTHPFLKPMYYLREPMAVVKSAISD